MKKLLLAFLCKVFGHKSVYDGRLYHHTWNGVRCYEYRHCSRCGLHKGTFEAKSKLPYVSHFRPIEIDDRTVRFWDLLATLIVSIALTACGSDHSADVSKVICGYDYLGILHKDWPCEESIARLEDCDEIQLGYLATTFGNNRQCLDRFLADERLSALRVHSVNGPCVTNKRCDKNEPLYGLDWDDIGEIQRRTKEAMRKEIAQIRVGSEMIYLSPLLEHKLSIEDFEPIGRAAQEICPRCIIVDNPVIARQSRFLPEFHGIQPAIQTPYGYSIDGYLGMSDELLESNNIAAYALDWDVSFNGICIDGPWVFPLDRKCF